jgi:hypothetical protein
MAMANCKECKKEVSTEAKTCPHCGVAAPVKKKLSTVTKVFVGTFFGLIAAVIMIPSNSPATKTAAQPQAQPQLTAPKQQPQPKEEEPTIEVKASALFEEYQSNEARADAIYKGKKLHVIAKLNSIDKDFMDNIVLSLATSNEFMPVRATLDDSQKQQAINLNKGTKITLLCTGNGMIVGSPVLDECLIK